MNDTIVHHSDDRLGNVAVDLRLLTQAQVDTIRMQVAMAKSGADGGGAGASFAAQAVALGLLTPESLLVLEAEEERRRRLISGYEIISRIGTGTIATAYRAMQIAMERQVALKILHPSLAADPVFVRVYVAEAQAVSRFHHPNIVQGFDVGESNGFIYFAHEYLSGGSVADKLKSGGRVPRFSETQLLTYLRQTTAALRHAWAVAVYHGDINPGNLLMDSEGTIKLANLGVPRVAGLRDMSGRGNGSAFVRAGPEYAAPEQLDKPELVDAATDMYNLGATFYHISFGQLPFAAPNGMTLAQYRKENPLPSFALESDYSPEYLHLLHDMLEFDPAKRIRDPEELADRLENFHRSSGDDPARSVRQVVPPRSAAESQRLTVSARTPMWNGHERRFSLRRRGDAAQSLPGVLWLRWGALAGVLAAAAGFLLFG